MDSLDVTKILDNWTNLGAHTCWPLDLFVVALAEGVGGRLKGDRRTSHATLLTTAMNHGGRLSMMDEGLWRLVAEGESPSICVITM